MSDLNMQFVREFFELNRFHVLTHWQHDSLVASTADASCLLFVENTRGRAPGTPAFLLKPGDLHALERAVVEVRAWHGDRFYPSVVESSQILSHVVQQETQDLAADVFNDQPFTSILVISELPASPRHRTRSLDLLQARGIGHVLEFSAILADMLEHVSLHGNYAPSQTLQTLRLLKRYDLLRRQQLEFSFPHDPPPGQPGPVLDLDQDPEESVED